MNKLQFKIFFLFILIWSNYVSSSCSAVNIDSLYKNPPKTKHFQKLSVEGHSFIYGLFNSIGYLKKFGNPVMNFPTSLKEYFSLQKQQIKKLPQANSADSNEVKLNIIGDIMWMRNNWDNFMDSSVQSKIKNCDLLLGNLETIIDTTKAVNKFWFDYRTYNSDKQLIDFLPASKSMLSIANNHSLDRGYESLLNTEKLLINRKIAVNGINKIKKYTSITIKGIKIGFYACIWGLNNPKAEHQDKLNIQKGIAPYNNNPVNTDEAILALKQMHDDGIEFKILFIHWGYEYEFYPRNNIMKLAHQLAQAGFNMIIGSHPHVFQPAELIFSPKNNLDSLPQVTLVNYSLGNFCTSMYSIETRIGVIESVNLKRNNLGKIEITMPNYEFVYNMPHIGKRKRKLLILADYMKLYPKEANSKFKERMIEIMNILKL
ncbi:MAG: CapA family protein [Bacteroidota bacterium]